VSVSLHQDVSVKNGLRNNLTNINLQETGSQNSARTSIGSTRATAESSMPLPKEEYKMVLCVNSELKMTKGKVAAQCCHAAVAVVRFEQFIHFPFTPAVTVRPSHLKYGLIALDSSIISY
jgi:hypothetical protein